MSAHRKFSRMRRRRELPPGVEFVRREDRPPAPEPAALDALKPGDFVKIMRGDERFWSVVTATQPLTARVNNYLYLGEIHGLRYGDIIPFDKAEVIQIIPEENGDDHSHCCGR